MVKQAIRPIEQVPPIRRCAVANGKPYADGSEITFDACVVCRQSFGGDRKATDDRMGNIQGSGGRLAQDRRFAIERQ